MSSVPEPWHREVGTLFWLQWKLTLSTLRSRRTRHRSGAVRMLLLILQVLFSVPIALGMAFGLGAGIALLTPQAAFEVTILANTLIALLWMLTPGAYSSQILERFEMSRLFVHPIRPGSIVMGSTLISLLTATGLWTIPLLIAQILGLAWHVPLALPFILLASVPLFLFLTLLVRIVEDVFDLIANDRRLRSLMLFLISIPFMLLSFTQLGVQFLTDDFSEVPSFLEDYIDVERLAEAEGLSEVIEIIRPSQWLLWLPPGWVTAGMAYAVVGMWGRAVLFLVLGTLTVLGLLGLHAFVTLRLMRGAAVTVGTSKVRRSPSMTLPVPSTLGALLAKDLRHLWRNPMPRRLIFGILVMVVMIGFSLSRLPHGPSSGAAARRIPIELLFLLLVMVSMTLNVGLSANYFGTIDREGFGSLMVTGIDRRLVILSANLVTLLLAVVAYGLPLIVVLMMQGTWDMLPLLLFLAVTMQISSTPAYTLAAILAPSRASLSAGMQRQGGNIWGLIAWGVSSLPVAILVLVPRYFNPAFLWVTIPFCTVYTLGIYIITLKPLAGLMLRRESALFEAITSD
jgi:hypothetical protein